MDIRDLSLAELNDILTKLGQPEFRVKQVKEWLYKKSCRSLDEMRNIPKQLIDELKDKFKLRTLPAKYILNSANNDAIKIGFETFDKKIIESVILLDNKRRTLCISSQIGCALGCIFCETGKLGLVRNLTLSEVVNQLIGANYILEENGDKLITNIVFMGMGEALSNFSNFEKAVEIFTDRKCFGIGNRKITVSTAGVVPSIKKLSLSKINVGLAVSLNTYNDVHRNKIMPINKFFPIEELIESVKFYISKKNKKVTFEYVVIENENDTPEAAKALIRLLNGIYCKINLIPLNPHTSTNLSAPTKTRLDSFAQNLVDGGITVVIRKSRGRDISGACGQLAGKKI